MIMLTVSELELARKQRQIRDLVVARLLWQRYELEEGLMRALAGVCRVGAVMTKRLLQQAAVDDRAAWWAGAKGYLKGGATILDIFEGKPINTQTVFDLAKKPNSFWNVGNVGCYFRFHAEVREKLAGEAKKQRWPVQRKR